MTGCYSPQNLNIQEHCYENHISEIPYNIAQQACIHKQLPVVITTVILHISPLICACQKFQRWHRQVWITWGIYIVNIILIWKIGNYHLHLPCKKSIVNMLEICHKWEDTTGKDGSCGLTRHYTHYTSMTSVTCVS